MKYIIYISLISLLAWGCHTPSHLVGGPCTYKTEVVRAKVVSVYQVNGDDFNIKFTATALSEHANDTFDYKHLYDQYIKLKTIRLKRIHPGMSIPFRAETITHGTCTPFISTLLIDSLATR